MRHAHWSRACVFFFSLFECAFAHACAMRNARVCIGAFIQDNFIYSMHSIAVGSRLLISKQRQFHAKAMICNLVGNWHKLREWPKTEISKLRSTQIQQQSDDLFVFSKNPHSKHFLRSHWNGFYKNKQNSRENAQSKYYLIKIVWKSFSILAHWRSYFS